MKKKTIILSIFLVLFILILTLIICNYQNIFIKKDNKSNNNLTEHEKFYNWETNLNIKAMDLFNNVFDYNYEFEYDNNGEYIITLSDFQNKYNVDFKDFNTDTIICDLNNSTYKVVYDSDEPLRSVHLDCEHKK